MIADWDFYKNEYHGIVIPESEYPYFGEGASYELSPFSERVPKTDEAQTALKRCACKISDILYGDFKSSKNGQRITSESVSGYYSVGYSARSDLNGVSAVRQSVNSAISLHIGKYVLGACKVIR